MLDAKKEKAKQKAKEEAKAKSSKKHQTVCNATSTQGGQCNFNNKKK